MVVALATFTLAAVFIVLLPGPDTLVVLRALVRGGRRRAIQTVAGVLCGLTVWVLAAALGLSAVLRASHDGYTALRLAGAAYLLWLGVQSVRSRTVPTAGPDPAAPDPAVGEPSGRARRGLLGTGYGAGLATDLLNPKVGIFFVTFLPGFIPHGYPVGPTALAFGGLFVALTAGYFAGMLALAGRVHRWMTHPIVRRRLDRITGLILIGFGVRLATESS
jgi:threonine/homoserine/homoserine lactone efflux protein